MLLSDFRADELNAVFDALGQEVRSALAEIPGLTAKTSEARIAYLRYVGQGHEVLIDLPVKTYDRSDATAIKQEFEATYRKVYGRNLPNADAELLTVGLSVSVPQRIDVTGSDKQTATADSASEDVRKTFSPSDDRFLAARIYKRETLIPSQNYAGPCFVEEKTTTTFVSGAFDVSLDAANNLVLKKKSALQELEQ